MNYLSRWVSSSACRSTCESSDSVSVPVLQDSFLFFVSDGRTRRHDIQRSMVLSAASPKLWRITGSTICTVRHTRRPTSSSTRRTRAVHRLCCARAERVTHQQLSYLEVIARIPTQQSALFSSSHPPSPCWCPSQHRNDDDDARRRCQSSGI